MVLLKQNVKIRYKEFNGVINVLKIKPKKIWFGHTAWHPVSQWLLKAHDFTNKEDKDLAMKDIQEWGIK